VDERLAVRQRELGEPLAVRASAAPAMPPLGAPLRAGAGSMLRREPAAASAGATGRPTIPLAAARPTGAQGEAAPATARQSLRDRLLRPAAR
jgi:hypothetical protein